MRVRIGGAVSRLLLVLILVVAAVPTGFSSPGVPTGAPAETAAAKASKNERAKDTGKAKQDTKRKSKGKHKRGKGAPASLKANRIAAEKADTLDAMECGDLIAIRVDDRVFCTHGEDPAPPGAGRIAAEDAIGPPAPPLCIHDGVSGPRIQMVYIHRTGKPNRLDELLPTFRRLASEMDVIFDQSARKTGESLRVRYVTDANCRVDFERLAVPERALDSFSSLIQKMHEAGFDAIDRKYLMMVDASVYCGVGTFAGGDKADDPRTEAHDFTGYARIDLPCWDAGSMAHELAHTMGAVQNSAPHTSRGGHCIDEWDVMCYSDEPFRPKMRTLCKDGAQDFRLDCGDNDYFSARPSPGSYLDRHWNMAESQYLTPGGGPTCVDARLEPDDAFWYDYWEVPMPGFPVGKHQKRAFCAEPGDVDWALLRAKAGTSYRIETTDLAPGVDTQVILYRGLEEQRWDGMDEFAVNDDRAEGDPSSAITFTAPADGTFLVGIAEADERAGLDLTYTLSIEKVDPGSSPTVSLSPGSAKPGSSFTVTVRDLEPASSVAIWRQRNGNSSKLGAATADADGTARATFTVPRGLPKGVYQIEAIAENRSAATATLEVIDSRDGKSNGKGNRNKNGKTHRDQDEH